MNCETCGVALTGGRDTFGPPNGPTFCFVHFLEFATDGKKVADGVFYITCKSCNGTGSVECHECYGMGDHECSCGNNHECGECDGEGKLECDECDGRGSVAGDDLPVPLVAA